MAAGCVLNESTDFSAPSPSRAALDPRMDSNSSRNREKSSRLRRRSGGGSPAEKSVLANEGSPALVEAVAFAAAGNEEVIGVDERARAEQKGLHKASRAIQSPMLTPSTIILGKRKQKLPVGDDAR